MSPHQPSGLTRGPYTVWGSVMLNIRMDSALNAGVGSLSQSCLTLSFQRKLESGFTLEVGYVRRIPDQDWDDSEGAEILVYFASSNLSQITATLVQHAKRLRFSLF